MRKKSVPLVLAFLLIFAGSAPVYADSGSSGDGIYGGQQINYVYLSAIGSGLSINTSGYATCSGYLILLEDYNSSLTLTLQRSNGSGWSDVKSWSQSYTGKGSHSMQKGYYVYSGYNYRVLTTAKVINGSTVIETASVSSPIEHY